MDARVSLFERREPQLLGSSSPRASALDEKKNVRNLKRKKGKKVSIIPDSRNLFKYILASSRYAVEKDVQERFVASNQDVCFRFGVVADVQYAKLPTMRGVKMMNIDGERVAIRRRRAWCEALPRLNSAIHFFNEVGVDFLINLGDSIEGHGDTRVERNISDLRKVLSVFARCKSDVHHVIGNHCRNLSMETLLKDFSLSTPYRSFCPAAGWKCIVLNTSELSAYAVDNTISDREALAKIVGAEKRVEHHFNGAVGEQQLSWLEQQLDEAVAEKQHVIIFSHYPLADESARRSHVLANTRAVRLVIERPGSPVVLCMAGHDHMGGFLSVRNFDASSDINYFTMPAILEAPKDQNAYGLVTAFSNGNVHVQGFGTVMSCVMERGCRI